MYIAGKKSDAPWVVGIRDPRGKEGSTFAAMPIEDHSFSTSGDYERGFVKENIRYHHILDPRTGQPARLSRSVTVKAKDAFTADAWSKVMFILGYKEALEVIKREKLTDFEVVWVDDKNTVHMTPAIEKQIKILKDPTPGI
jgi:thiamine biosynthesis lipoprotein